MPLRPLKTSERNLELNADIDSEYAKTHEWRDTSGNLIQLCIVEELAPEGLFSAEAITTFGGFALCRDHFEKITDLIKGGMPMGTIVNQIMTEGIDD